MISIDKDLQPIILFYILIFVSLYYLKPPIMFDNQGKMLPFGTGVRKTIAPLWLVASLGSIVFYVFMKSRKDTFA